MTPLLSFALGIGTALLYFGHMYWQITQLAKGGGRTLLLGFALRFGLLCLWFGLLFAHDAAAAFYAVGGMIAGRLGLQYYVSARR